MCTRRCKINLQQSATDKIRRWTWNVKEMEQKAEKHHKMTQKDILKCNQL